MRLLYKGVSLSQQTRKDIAGPWTDVYLQSRWTNPTHNPNSEVIKQVEVNNHSLHSKQEQKGYPNNKGKQKAG